MDSLEHVSGRLTAVKAREAWEEREEREAREVRDAHAARRTLQCSPQDRRAEMLQARLTRISIAIFRLARLARAMAHSNGRLYLGILQCCRPSGPALCFRPQDAIGARQGLVRRTFMQRGDD